MTFSEKWLKAIAAVHIIGGLLLPLMVFTPLATPYFEHLQQTFPSGDEESMKFFIGIFGPTVASWGLLFYYSIGKAFQSQTPKDWWFLVSAVLIWGIMDNAFSLYFGVITHLYINGLALILILIPLTIHKKHFTNTIE